MPITYYLGGRQYSADELNAKRKVGSIETGSIKHVSIKDFKTNDRASLVTDIGLKFADKNIAPSDRVQEFMANEDTPISELSAFLNDETNFFVTGSLIPKTRGRPKLEKTLEKDLKVEDNISNPSLEDLE